MKPIDAKKEQQIVKLYRDNYPARNGRWSIMISEGSVSLFPPAFIPGHFTIPRSQFDAIVRWYITDQASPPKRGQDRE